MAEVQSHIDVATSEQNLLLKQHLQIKSVNLYCCVM